MIRWRGMVAGWCAAAVASGAPLTLHQAQQELFEHNSAIRTAEAELGKAYAGTFVPVNVAATQGNRLVDTESRVCQSEHKGPVSHFA